MIPRPRLESSWGLFVLLFGGRITARASALTNKKNKMKTISAYVRFPFAEFLDVFAVPQSDGAWAIIKLSFVCELARTQRGKRAGMP